MPLLVFSFSKGSVDQERSKGGFYTKCFYFHVETPTLRRWGVV